MTIKGLGGGSYWAGWAAARPLFGPCGPPIGLARPLLATWKQNFESVLPECTE